MPILPVLDLMQGQIVRGIAGKRDEYRPIVSKLTDSAEPLAVANAMRQHFGFTEFYLADLDAIQQGQLAFDVYRRLGEAGVRLWIDAGIACCPVSMGALAEPERQRRANAALRWRSGSETDRIHQPAMSSAWESFQDAAIDELVFLISQVIVGLECVKSPTDLRHIVERVGAKRTVFSLDLKAGQPLGDVREWPSSDPFRIAEHAIATLGVRRLIVLDLAHIGIGKGVGTEVLCVRLKKRFPEVQLTTGGGVRHIDDVKHLLALGVEYVLVASALHDGRITPEDVKRL